MSNKLNEELDRKGSNYNRSRYERRSRSRSRSTSPNDRRHKQYSNEKNRYESGRSTKHKRLDEDDSDDEGPEMYRRKLSKKLSKSEVIEKDSNWSDDNPIQPPPPPRIGKVSMAFGGAAKVAPVQMKLTAPKPQEPAKKIKVASVFSNDSDDEVEEMPPECRMRMKNIGRDTPTSSGPNSFGKTKQGFCDAKKIFEKNMRDDYFD